MLVAVRIFLYSRIVLHILQGSMFFVWLRAM